MWLKISLSWLSGSGKSSLIRAIVQKYGFATADIGQMYRQRAIAKWLTIAEYDKLTEQNPQEDIEIDNELKELVANCPTDIIVSWRMWFHLLPSMTTIRLDVSPEEWAKRIFLDDRGKQEKKYADVQEAMEADHDRMARLRDRLQKLYGVDFTNKSYYTKILDTTGKTFEQNLEQLENYIKTLRQ